MPTAELRCSVQALHTGDSPVGSAGHAALVILVELPLPWPSEITRHELLAGLAGAGPATVPTMLLGVTSDRLPLVGADGGRRYRVIVHQARGSVTDGGFAGYVRHEAAVTAAELVPLIIQARMGDLGRLARSTDPPVDVLICTHGARDRCCGGSGTALYLSLAADPPADVRLWRTSHTGGHRFAPVALTFPDGFTWSRVDAPTLTAIVDRSITPAMVAEHNRGCLGITPAVVQAADAAALTEVGWSWLDAGRVGEVQATEGPRHEVRITSGDDTFLTTIAAGDRVPVPPCGEPLDQAVKFTIPLQVVGSRRGQKPGS